MAAESDPSPITDVEVAADQPQVSAADESPVSAAETGATPAVKKGRKRSVTGEVATPVERPSRERKTVERYVHVSPRKAPPPKSIAVVQGPGTMLKDIPNVFFKLSKRKSDETLQVLHTILHGRKANARYLKSNIFQFSGYVWAADEEKQKLKVQEKLDKLTRDRLIDLCDLLDIQSARSVPKKDIIEKLFLFLESPCSTRDVNLAEKKKKGNQKKKKKKTRGAGRIKAGEASSEGDERKSSPKTEMKKRKRQSTEGKKRKEHEGTLEESEEDLSSSDNEDGIDSSDNDDIPNAEIDDNVSEEENDKVDILKQDKQDKPETFTSSDNSSEKEKHVEPKLKKKLFGDSAADSDKSPSKPASPDAEDVTNVPSPKRRRSLKSQTSTPSIPDTKGKSAANKKDSVKSRKTKLNSSPRQASVDTSNSGPPLSSKAKKENKKKETRSDNSASADNKPANKQASSRATKVSATAQVGSGKGKASENSKAGPGKEELRSVVSVVLKKVDFNKTTLKDIVNQLGEHFDMDLMPRKKEIKGILEEVINSMNAEQDSEEEADTKAEEDGEEKENGNVEEDGKQNDDMIVEEDDKDNDDDMNAEENEDGGEKGAK